jgi:hypothetical protein
VKRGVRKKGDSMKKESGGIMTFFLMGVLVGLIIIALKRVF